MQNHVQYIKVRFMFQDILCGLLQMTLQIFENINRKSPVSWEEMRSVSTTNKPKRQTCCK